MADRGPELLRVRQLTKEFRRSASRGTLVAVRDVSLDLWPGETLAVVGETGSGKTTLGRMILGLTTPTSGSIHFAGRDITALPWKQRRSLCTDIQVIFQDPYSSLDPRKRVEDIIREPLDIHKIGTRSQRRGRVHELMDLVALAPGYRQMFPHELSGGLRQRVGIAAALAPGPQLIVADEPVSALDVSVQAQILELLADIQRETSVALLFISHDLGVVHQVSDRIAVMCQGEFVEVGPLEAVYSHPQHPYTRALLSAIPPADPSQPYSPIVLPTDTSRASEPPGGCRFRDRCWLAEEICAAREPALTERAAGISARCHVTARLADRAAAGDPRSADQVPDGPRVT